MSEFCQISGKSHLCNNANPAFRLGSVEGDPLHLTHAAQFSGGQWEAATIYGHTVGQLRVAASPASERNERAEPAAKPWYQRADVH